MSGGFNPINIVSQVALAAATGGTSMLLQAAITAVVSAVAQQVIQQVGQQLGLPPEVINMAQSAFQAASGNVGGAAQGVGSFAQQGVSGFAQNFAQQSLGNLAGGGLQAALSNLNQIGNLSPAQMGQINHAVDNANQKMTNQAVQMINAQANSPEATDMTKALVTTGLQQTSGDIKQQANGKAGSASAASSAGKSFLMAIADALGAAVDQKMSEMVDLGDKIKGQVDSNTKFADGLKSDAKGGDLAKANNNSQKLGTYNSELQAVSQELSILQNVISTTLKTVGEAQSTIARKG